MAERGHSLWAASATERNWNCAGALALTKDLPGTTSQAADWGTCCHELSELCLRNGHDATEYLGRVFKGQKYEFQVDDEMCEVAQIYVDHVRASWIVARGTASRATEATLSIEQKFTLDALSPPFEAGGTADAVVYYPGSQMLEVVDLKTGKGGTVEVTENKQLRTYALGAILTHRKQPAQQVKVTIVQPRKPHKDGRIRSETFHVADLMEWTHDLLAAMRRSKQALDERRKVQAGEMAEAVWNATYLTAGSHCEKTFCGAFGFCPAARQAAQDAAGVWFDDLDQPRISNSPDSMSPEQIAQALDTSDLMEGWINAVRAYAHAQAEIGVSIPNYVLVEKVGRRKWIDEANALSRLEAAGVDPYVRKPVSPAQAEKLLGTKRKGEIKDLVETPITGTNLVRADKTSRPAIQSVAHMHFQALE